MSEQEIFEAALARDAELRPQYLDEACGADSELRQRIENLLKFHEEAGEFFEKPAAEIVATLDQPITEKPGTQIGPYKLLQQIGEGGMGVVYMAEQHEPVRRKVALKIIKPGMDTRQVIGRFEAERQALSLMDHPNIARVLDAGTTDSGRPYFVMELVKGQPITEYCDEHHLTPRQRLEMLVPVCQAIQHAHQKGIIHRDIKPSNILVAEYDEKTVPKVIDFGVAKATSQPLTERTMFTGFGQIVGTLEYMSPEQAKVNQLDIDTRSDVYSLGVLMYELLTGTTPFDKQRLRSAAFDEMLRIIREEEPPKPSTRLSESQDSLPSLSALRHTEPAKLTKLVRGELDWIVMKALEKERGRRYETANALARDVERFLADEPVEACPPTVGYRLRKFTRKHKIVLRTTGVITMLLVLGAVVSTWQAIRATKAEALARENHKLAERHAEMSRLNERSAKSERDIALAARDDLHRALYVSDMNLLQVAWEEGNIVRARELLGRQTPTAGQPDLRGFEWYYWDRLCHPEQRVFQLEGPIRFVMPYFGTAISRDGTRITAAGYGVLKVWDAVTGKACLSVPTPIEWGGTSMATISADGTRIAAFPLYASSQESERPRDLKLWDATTGKELLSLSLPGGRSTSFAVALNTDATRIATFRNSVTAEGLSSDCGELTVWDASTGRSLFTVPTLGLIVQATFSPDGRRIAATVQIGGKPYGQGLPDRSTVQVWDAATGGELFTLNGSASLVFFSLAFSPDCERIAAGGVTQAESGAVWVWNANSGEQLLVIPTPHFRTLTLFSPDGKSLAGYSPESTLVCVWDVSTGISRLTLKGNPGGVCGLAFLADRSKILTTTEDGVVNVWDATIEEDDQDASGHGPLAISPDGRRLARLRRTAGDAGEIAISDASGRKIRTLPPMSGVQHALALSRDGEFLAAILRASQNNKTRYEVKVWDLASGREPRTLVQKDESDVVGAMAFSPDGTRFAELRLRARARVEARLTVWDLPAASELFSRDSVDTGDGSIAFSPDGKRIAVGFDNPGTGDSRPAGIIRILDAVTGKELQALEGDHPGSHCTTFSPDGMLLASASREAPQVIQVWDVYTGEKRSVLEGHAKFVSCLAFSPDGRRLVSVGPSGAGFLTDLRIWDPQTGSELLNLKVHSMVEKVVFGPNGNQLRGLSSSDGRTRIWDATPRDNMQAE